MISWCSLTSRTLLVIDGPERVSFLQGLVTQNITENHASFSAILTPQGRFFSDFFVLNTEKRLLLDCAKEHKEALLKLLQPYALLHDVSLYATNQYAVCAAIGVSAVSLHEQSPFYNGERNGSIFFKDPRNSAMGLRAWIPYAIWNELPHSYLVPSCESLYHRHRMNLGIAEGAYDLVREQSIILEYGYQHIHAISWSKGCYMGQELMARTFYRGSLRKHLHRITLVDGSFPPLGSILSIVEPSFSCKSDDLCDYQRVGWMGGHGGTLGLAVLHESVDNISGGHMPLVLYSDNGHTFSVLIRRIAQS